MYVPQGFMTWSRIEKYLKTVEIFCSPAPSDKIGILSHYRCKQEARKRARALNEAIECIATPQEKKHGTL